MLVYDFVMEKIAEIRGLGIDNEDLDNALMEIEMSSTTYYKGLCPWIASSDIDDCQVTFEDDPICVIDALSWLRGRFRLLCGETYGWFEPDNGYTAFHVEQMNEIAKMLVEFDWSDELVELSDSYKKELRQFAQNIIDMYNDIPKHIGFNIKIFGKLAAVIIERI